MDTRVRSTLSSSVSADHHSETARTDEVDGEPDDGNESQSDDLEAVHLRGGGNQVVDQADRAVRPAVAPTQLPGPVRDHVGRGQRTQRVEQAVDQARWCFGSSRPTREDRFRQDEASAATIELRERVSR